MEKPEKCKFCQETEFKFHETVKIYNPETNEEEDEKDVYECLICNTYHFETEEHTVVQIGKTVNDYVQKPKLANYMNSK